MSLVIEVFRSDDYVPAGEIPLMPLLRAAFEDVIGTDATGVKFELYFYELLDLTRDRGKPSLVNLRASHGFVRVRIWRDGELLYQHPHPVRELVGGPLRELLKIRDPDVDHWGYGLSGPGLESIALARPAPRITHELRVTSGPRRRSTFTVEEMPDPEPPEIRLADLGADTLPASTGPHPITRAIPEPADEAAEPTDEAAEPTDEAAEPTDEAAEPVTVREAADAGAPDADASPLPQPAPTATTTLRTPDGQAPPVVIAVHDSIVTAFVQTFPFSEEIEEGGFLAGQVYRDADHPGGYVVHVTAAIPAERTGASIINFTFTGESFLRVSEQLAARADGEVLLGWYHTHLFPATSRSGLSSVDVDLHRSTFRRPWQVAALVNISTDGRVLRFYHGEGDEMAKVPYWTVPS